MKDALTTGEVAKYCGVNFRTVIRWIEKGYMEAYKLPGRGDNRVPIESLVTFLKKNGMPIPEEFQAVGLEAEALDQSSTVSAEEEFKATKLKVLIIEDEALMAKSITRTLKRAGYEVKVASNGIEAGIQLERYKPQIITLDLQMPGMSGFEVLEALRVNDSYQHIKVLVVSAATKVKMLEVMELGVDDVLEKPFKSEALVAKLLALVSE